MISREACPRMQRKPRLSGLSGSPLTLTRCPSSTSTRMPHSVGWQFIGHIVRKTPVVLVTMPYRIVEAALTGIAVGAILPRGRSSGKSLNHLTATGRQVQESR